MIRRHDGTEIPAEAWSALVPPGRQEISACTLIRPGVPYGPRTVLVAGAYRGGTSFAAERLIALGVPMGDRYMVTVPKNDYECLEDVDFVEAISDIMRNRRQGDPGSNEWRYLRQLVADRDTAHDVWGFKCPAVVYVIDYLLSVVRNPHLVVMVRDPLAVMQSDAAHGGAGIWSTARHNMACVLDLIEKPRAPTLAISFERGQHQRAAVEQHLKEFLGL